MGQLVDKHNFGAPRQDGVHIHFLEHGALIVDLLARHGFQLFGEILHAFAPVRFDDTDDDILAAAAPANRFAQHAVGLPHTGRISEEELEDSAGLGRGGS